MGRTLNSLYRDRRTMKNIALLSLLTLAILQPLAEAQRGLRGREALRCRGCPGLSGQVNSSLTISGPGHDGVIQETIINPDSNEAVISVPAHGNNMAQEVVLQGRGGSNEVSSPL